LTTRAGSRDHVGVGNESYPAALDLMRARGLVPVAPLTGVRVRYVMPAIDNPRGRGMADGVRRMLISTGPPIIEDDAYADLAFDGPAARPLLADAPHRVLHVGTLSKTLCPGLRIGWLVVPRRLRSRALRFKQSADLQASSLGQAVSENYLLGDGHTPPVDFDARLVRLRRFYRRRATMLARALRQELPAWRFTHPSGGFAIWVEAPADAPPVDELTWLRAALHAGVMFDPGSSFRPDEAAASSAARLCFSSAPADKLAVGVRRFALAWRRCVAGRDV
jgi:2-aminoadipate transaminase